MGSQSEYIAETIDDVVYAWSLEPEAAGNIIGEGRQVYVEWNSDYRGEASISYSYENACGSTALSELLTVNVFNSTATEEQTKPSVKVYPNPAKDLIHIETDCDGEMTLRFIDLTGKVVYECGALTLREGQGQGTATIATSMIGGSGIYTLQVNQNGNLTNVKVVVMP